MKKLLTGILASTMLLSSMSMVSFATEIPENTQKQIQTATLASPESDFEFYNGEITKYLGDGGDVVIPSTIGGETVTKIGVQLFTNIQVTTVTIPETVIEFGSSVFFGATVLTAINVHENNQVFTSIDGILYSKDETLLMKCPEGKVAERIIIPQSVQEISAGAFDRCMGIESITIPSSVTRLERYTFSYESNLKSINIPSSITEMGEGVFLGCPQLVDIYYEGTEEQWNALNPENIVSLGIDWFNDFANDDHYHVYNDYTVHYNSTMEDATTPEPETTTPVYSSWAEPQVTFAEENNLIVDSLGNDYTKSITRTQIADLLVNMMEQYTETTLESASTDTFTDTTSEAVLKAYEVGIISGKGEGIFDPEATATRQEIAIMIVNAIKVLEENTGESFVDHSLTSLDGFSDFDTTADWAQNHVAILANNGIMTGSDGNLTPLSETSIQECLVLNNNLFKFGE